MFEKTKEAIIKDHQTKATRAALDSLVVVAIEFFGRRGFKWRPEAETLDQFVARGLGITVEQYRETVLFMQSVGSGKVLDRVQMPASIEQAIETTIDQWAREAGFERQPGESDLELAARATGLSQEAVLQQFPRLQPLGGGEIQTATGVQA